MSVYMMHSSHRHIEDKGLGVRWLHTGGIFAALSDGTAEVALEAVQVWAQDFLLKDHIDGPVLSRALSYAIERKRLEGITQQLAYSDGLTSSILLVQAEDAAAALAIARADVYVKAGVWGDISARPFGLVRAGA